MGKRPDWVAWIAVRLRKDVPLALLDLGLVFAAYLGPLVLRFDGRIPHSYWSHFWYLLLIASALHLVCNSVFGLYGQMWRYASVREARQVLLSGLVAGTLLVASGYVWSGTRPIPLSVLVFGALGSIMAFGAVRFQSRLFAFRRRLAKGDATKILVVGAGDAADMLLRDMQRDPSRDLDPVGVVDDDLRKLGRSLQGVRVLGTRAAIPSLVRDLDVEQVLLAIPSATSEVIRDVAALCEEADVTLRVVPSVREVVGGRITARDIRDLQVEDLLGRAQVETDLEAVRAFLQGRRVMVTGAGGSIGSEICRQVARLEPSALILLDHDESLLHDIEQELLGHGAVEAVLADIRESERLLEVCLDLRPEVVFHAAAHKHVPLLERYPQEAVLTNVLGTANLVDAAVAAGTERFVFISTDKAVRPASVMGATKWFAEQIVRSVRESGCIFCAVRFGNVLGSRGSVIPTFFRQIARGGPVTVTDPSMARYFMSTQEAVQLVLQAGALSEGGEVLTLDMGEPVNILQLARKLIRLSGRVPGRDVPIEIVGVRPGEKIVEELVDPEEEQLPSSHPGITMARPPVPDRPGLRRALRTLEALAREADEATLAEWIKELARGTLRESYVLGESA